MTNILTRVYIQSACRSAKAALAHAESGQFLSAYFTDLTGRSSTRACQLACRRSLIAFTNFNALGGLSTRALFARKTSLVQSWKGAGFEDTDIAVFRFTLGIPGFDDAQIPRVVGILGAALILLNHVLDQSGSTAAQARTEALGVLLSAICIATPTIGSRLQAAQPGRGRQAGSQRAASDSVQVFQIATAVSQTLRTELAWASFALLRNTNSTGVIVASKDSVWVARGCFGGDMTSCQILEQLDRATRAVSGATASCSQLSDIFEGRQQCEYLPDEAAIFKAGASSWGILPRSTQSLLLQGLQPLPQPEGAGVSGNGAFRENALEGAEAGQRSAGVLLLWSDRPRALSQRERLWAAAVAAKLRAVLLADMLRP